MPILVILDHQFLIKKPTQQKIRPVTSVTFLAQQAATRPSKVPVGRHKFWNEVHPRLRQFSAELLVNTKQVFIKFQGSSYDQNRQKTFTKFQVVSKTDSDAWPTKDFRESRKEFHLKWTRLMGLWDRGSDEIP